MWCIIIITTTRIATSKLCNFISCPAIYASLPNSQSKSFPNSQSKSFPDLKSQSP